MRVLDRLLRDINPQDLDAMLGEPDGGVAATAADLQNFHARGEPAGFKTAEHKWPGAVGHPRLFCPVFRHTRSQERRLRKRW